MLTGLERSAPLKGDLLGKGSAMGCERDIGEIVGGIATKRWSVTTHRLREEEVAASHFVDRGARSGLIREAQSERQWKKGISGAEGSKGPKGIVDIGVEDPICGARP